MEGVSDKYAWVGECTGDKESRKTHYNPIFYRKDRLELLETGTVPYSETKGTIGFGAMYARACTWAKFMDRKTGKIFYFFNSHFDHQGVEAREVSAEILVSAVRRIAAGYPAFMTGDFNSDEDTVPYKIILKSGFIGDTMNAVQNPENEGVGIAAPQVGILRRLVAVQRFDKEGEPFEFFINPEIVAKDDTLVAGSEGCLSVPEIYDDVERSQRITLRYYDSSFIPHEEVIEGFTAVIFQHEIDHLDGKLFIDYLK